MRIISMVPSWTETLAEAGVQLVGRTRFCLHPENIKAVPVVGGTKDWDFDKIQLTFPSLIILDKEENPKWMAEDYRLPIIATHVRSVSDMPKEYRKLARALKNENLNLAANKWSKLLASPLPQMTSIEQIPGIIDWGRKPQAEIKKIIYIIWKNPWMTVSSDTFIGSVFSYCGMGKLLSNYDTKYPRIDLENLPDKESTLLLFSTEPYPFLKKKDNLENLGYPYAFIDGESFSWFGIRSYRFLEALHENK